MQKIVTSRSDLVAALKAFRANLTESLGRPTKATWSFPGGGRIELKTWSRGEVLERPLAVAVGANNDWATRTPVLIARSQPHLGMTPIVEVNVPVTNGTPNRAVAGCFYQTPESGLVLAHRGSSFSVSGGKIPKEAIHERFSKWLVRVDDGERLADVIPIAPTGPDVVSQLALFADEVTAFKDWWKSSVGSKRERSVKGAWRKDIRFPDAIARVVDAASTSFEYLHGPIQLALQRSVERCVPDQLSTALNQRVDLALLEDRAVAAIFEVKTDLGPQLYAGIGQLYWYREVFALPSTPLFLVLPGRVCQDSAVADIDSRLKHLGITLILERDDRFTTWDGSSLREALRSAGIALR